MSEENDDKSENNDEEEEESDEEKENEEEKKEKEIEKLKEGLKEKEVEKEEEKEEVKENNVKEKEEEEEEEEEEKENELQKHKNEMLYQKSENSENTEIKEEPTKLIVILIPKIKKELPFPLNTLFFFIELYSYENSLKKITDENNKLVFYLMNINWLDAFKSYYNYKCIEYIIHRELKENKNFMNKIQNLINNENPARYYEDYKLVDKFNNIIINPKKKKKFGENENDFMPMKVDYDVKKINKNILSSKLDTLESFKFFPKCVLINEKMRNILYLEYKYLKFSQFQKGDVTLIDKKVFIKLSNKIIEVCSFSHKNLIITPLYILYYFDISFVPFWENVLNQKDFQKDYLLKRIDKDDRHIQCMLDPFNKEYIGYCINLNIPYEGEPIKDFDEEHSVVNDIKKEELLKNIDIIGKFNMDGYYKNKFEENYKKNNEDDSYNQFLLKMKLLREKKAKELKEMKQEYINTFNIMKQSKNSESEKSGAVNINGEMIGFVQGDDLTKNGEGFVKSSLDSDYISSINEMERNKKKNE